MLALSLMTRFIDGGFGFAMGASSFFPLFLCLLTQFPLMARLELLVSNPIHLSAMDTA